MTALQSFGNSGTPPPEKNPLPIVQMDIHQRFVAQYTSGHVRLGQAWMNALYHTDPVLWHEISNTEADCFYDDTRIGAFKLKVFGKE